MQRAIEVLHTYTIEEQLYSRGLARGYRAWDEQLEDLVVLETVPSTYLAIAAGIACSSK